MNSPTRRLGSAWRSVRRTAAGGVAAFVLLGAVASAHPAAVLAASPCVTSGPAGGTYTATLCITAPANGATLTGEQTVSATLSLAGTGAPAGGKLIFYLDGAYLLMEYSTPFTFQLRTTHWVDGAHLLEVESLLRDGFLTSRASINLSFSNGILTPPVNTNARTWVPGTSPAPGQPFVIAATGDGASGEPSAGAVSDMITSWAPNMFLYTGDVYEKGTSTEFENWYGSSTGYFGRFKNITNPIVGNHEYEPAAGGGFQANGYFDYWDNIPHYYSYDASGWHFIALDSTSQYGQMTPGTAQYDWLMSDLAANNKACTVVFWHHPPYTTGPSTPVGQLSLYSAITAAGADILLTGHDHDYQRWRPMDASGNPDDANGITQFVVGAGGHGTQGFVKTDSRMVKGADTTPNAFGAIRLELNAKGAAYRYVNTAGQVLDSGSVHCSGAAADSETPTVPSGLSAVSGGSKVDLTWTNSTDDVGVTGYDVYRDGSFLATAAEPKYADTTAQVGTSYSYVVRARDAAGHVSAFSSAANVSTAAAVFSDGFESGNLNAWDAGATLAIESKLPSGDNVFAGDKAARATQPVSTGAAVFAKKTLSPSMNDIYYRAWFKVLSHTSTLDLLRFRTPTNTAILSVNLSSTNKLAWRNDVAGTSITDAATTVSLNQWHSVQAHVNVTTGTVEVWLDGVKNTTLSGTGNAIGSTAVGVVQIGEPQTNRTYDVLIDEAAVSTVLIPTAAAPLAAPASLTGTTAAGKVDLTWSAVTGVSLVGYSVFRDGQLLVDLGAVTTYSDIAIRPSTGYTYTVRARDLAGNTWTSSPVLSITSAPDTTPPSVTLTSPSANAIVRDFVTLSAAATDNAAVAHVDFMINGLTVGDTEDAPYSLVVDSNQLPEGPATVVAAAIDTAGLAAVTPATTVIIDNRLPDTTITGGPDPLVTSTSSGATFTFVADETGSTFQCSLDGAAYATCTSPKSYAGLADGTHTFSVVARDLAGNNDPSPATLTWTIDTTTADLAATGFESGLAGWTNAGSGLAVQGASVLEGASAGRATASSGSAWAYATLSATKPEVYFRSWVRIESQGANTVNLLKFRTDTGTALGGVFVNSAGRLGASNDTAGGSTLTSTTAVGTGWHELQAHLLTGTSGKLEVWLDGVQVTTLTINASFGTTPIGRLQLGENVTGRTFDVTYDEVLARSTFVTSPAAPFTVIEAGPSGAVSSTQATFAFSSTVAGSTFVCVVDGGLPAACTSPFTATGLADGAHSFAVAATGPGGIPDATAAARSFSVDTTAPSVTGTVPAANATGVAVDATITATLSEAADPATVTTSTVTLVPHAGGAAVAAAVSWDAGTSKITLDPSAALAGNTVYDVSLAGVQDAAGNALPATTWSFTTSGADSAAPSVPSGLGATPVTSGRIDLAWTASTDDTAVTAYDVFRGGALVASLGVVTSWSDTAVAPGTSYTYRVRARDAAGNASAQSDPASATTPAALFADRFETGDLSRWTTIGGLSVGTSEPSAGRYGARATSTGAAVYAFATLPAPRDEVWYRVHFKVVSQGANNIDLAGLRTTASPGLIGRLFVNTTGKLGFIDDATTPAATTMSTTTVSTGAWHELQLHAKIAGASGRVDVWLDGTPVGALSTTMDLGTTNIARLQLGEHLSGRTLDVAFDDVTAANAYIVDGDVTAPALGGSFTATPVTTARVDLAWSAASDATGVTGYDLYRNGARIASLGVVTSYNDTTAQPATAYTYELRARDAAENVSAAATASASTPADTSSPSVSVTAPADGASVGGSVSLAASATDDAAVARVDFLVDGSVVTTDTVAPFAGSWSSTTHADGAATITAQAYDATGNRGDSVAVHVTVDNAAPDTSITGGPADGSLSNVANPSFTFTGTEPGSFQCSVDAGAFAPCTSPASTGALADGSRTFRVRAVDAAGNPDATPAQRTWTVDTTAPTIGASGVTPVDGATNVALATDAVAVFSEAMDPATITTSTAFLTPATTASVSYDTIAKTVTIHAASGLAFGTTYTVTVKGGAAGAKDAAGNPLAADRTWSFATIAAPDTTPPDTAITSQPANPTNANSASFSFTSTEAGSTFQCKLDAGAWGTCGSPKSYNNVGSGTHTFNVRAIDAAANTDPTPATYQWVIDRVAPTVSSVSPAAGATGVSLTTTVTAVFSEAMDPATITTSTVKLTPQGSGTPVAATVAYDAQSRTATLTPSSPLGEGLPYTATVVSGASGVKDVAGNALATNRTWSFTTLINDSIPPSNVAITSPANGSTVTGTVTITASATDNLAVASVRFYIDGQLLATDTTSPYSASWATRRVTKTTHTMYVVATDTAGNQTQSTTISVLVQ
jgi:hypothetical protein